MPNLEAVKKWFGFTRRERRSSFILLIIIIFALAFRVVIPQKNIEVVDITAGINALMESNDLSVPLPDTFVVDPNTASYDTLLRMGLAEKEARTLISYRTKGGQFRKPSDIRKVYGLENKKAEKIIPFIKIGNRDTFPSKLGSVRQRAILDLNKCDSAMLESLPGIGPVLAVRILKYRNLLGGFTSADQLKEVYGLPSETFKLIRDRVYADTSLIRKIPVNSADFRQISRLPYLENYEIASILKYRELEGRIGSIDELIKNKILTQEKANMVNIYLDFR